MCTLVLFTLHYWASVPWYKNGCYPSLHILGELEHVQNLRKHRLVISSWIIVTFTIGSYLGGANAYCTLCKTVNFIIVFLKISYNLSVNAIAFYPSHQLAAQVFFPLQHQFRNLWPLESHVLLKAVWSSTCYILKLSCSRGIDQRSSFFS